MSLSGFTSVDAHNGCRALFNHTKGWAYIGSAIPIDSADFPGTVSYEYKKGPSSATRGAAPPTPPPPSRPGDGLGRKTNDLRRAYLDAADLEHLVHQAERLPCSHSGAPGNDLEEGGGGAEERWDAPRKGRPIVLTLQAILAATSTPRPPPASAAGDGSAATAVSATPAAGGEGGVRESGDDMLSSPRVSDHAQFPPLRGAQMTAGLLLAPPITMVKRHNKRQPAAAAAAAAAAEDSSYEDETGGVSCSEAVAAASVAEAAQVGVGQGMSRVGWWLRWSESGAPAGASTAAPTAAIEAGQRSSSSSSCSSAIDVVFVGGNDGDGSYETRSGVDGWQVVSGAIDAPAFLGVGERTQPAKASPSGGAWALVADNWAGKTGNPSGGVHMDAGVGEDDDASSWCDCASDADQVEVVEMLQGGRDMEGLAVDGVGGVGEANRRVDATLVDASHDAVYNDGGDRGVVTVAVAVALQRAANTSVWDRDEDADLEHPNRPCSSQQHLRSSESVVATTTNVPQSVPRSFRDMLMTPTATGETGFSRSKALVERRAVATAGYGNRTPLSSGPTLVGGTNEGAVYLWRKAAAGEGGKALDRDAVREDEDPYYARKRVGAFAFKTKPRGKAHK